MNVVRLNKKPSRIQKVERIVSSAAMGEIVSGFPPIPGINLKNKGGKTISDLSFAQLLRGKFRFMESE
jgi:vacuolar-type H+-ATPase subunit E/Vma4